MPGETNAERGRDVRARLLAAAASLIGEIGWNAVSTRLLAERAGVRSGLVHYHFASLQALLRQAALDAMGRTIEGATAVFERIADPAEAVDAMLADLDRYSGSDPASLLFIEAYLAATRDPELRERMGGLLTQARGALAAALERGGHPRPEDTARAVMAALDGFILHKGLDRELTAARLAPVLRRITETNGTNR